MTKLTSKANRGKICISICAKTARELSEKLRQADEIADVIEVRFDCLSEGEITDTLELLASLDLRSEFLATARPNTVEFFPENLDAGKTEVNTAFEDRISLWKRILQTKLFRYVDFEDDLVFALTYNELFAANLLEGIKVIGSHHNFYETPPDIGPVLEGFAPDETSKFHCDIVKVATTAHTITDTIEQWYLIDWAKHFGIKAVPISMGEPGKWTRILGLAHGAEITYAALDEGDETAPGQITAKDLIDVYRAREFNPETEVYGIIAGDTTYSMSPYIHNAAFIAAGMNRVFVPLQVNDIEEFIRRMVRPETREIDLNFRGFSVTNPHKQDIIRHIDAIDETAKAIGAVNTVKVEGDRLIGINTDANGFIELLLQAFEDLSGARVTVFGSGGAARACVYALTQHLADVTVVARDTQKLAAFENEFGVRTLLLNDNTATLKTDILVNATPLGTKGESEHETVATREQLADVKLVYDLTYNPAETKLLREAKAAGCQTLGGLDMLIAQGARQFEFWTGQTPSIEAMTAAANKRLKR